MAIPAADPPDHAKPVCRLEASPPSSGFLCENSPDVIIFRPPRVARQSHPRDARRSRRDLCAHSRGDRLLVCGRRRSAGGLVCVFRDRDRHRLQWRASRDDLGGGRIRRSCRGTFGACPRLALSARRRTNGGDLADCLWPVASRRADALRVEVGSDRVCQRACDPYLRGSGAPYHRRGASSAMPFWPQG